MDIRPEGGGASLVSGITVDGQGRIWVPEANLTPDATNYLRVRRDDGTVGAYSNAVSVAFDPDVNAQSANQVRAVSVSRSGTDVNVRWQQFQENGKTLRLYYERADGGGTLLLTPAGIASGTTTFSIQNQSLTVQCGYFYLTQQISGPTWSGPSPSAGLPPSGSGMDLGTDHNCAGGGPPPPPPDPSEPVWVDTFHHRDHLGSLRVVTDAGGWMIDEGHDYYPFGMEMVPPNTFTGGGSRKRFTGHERDEATGLDYMLGRFQSTAMGRFLGVDPSLRSVSLALPQTLNRYTYTRNNPLSRVDPDGRADVKSEVASTAFGCLPVAGEVQDATIALTGYDPITSEQQSTGTRVTSGVAFFVPVVGGKLIDKIVGRVGEFLRHLFRGSDVVLSSNPILDRALKDTLSARGAQADRVQAFERVVQSSDATKAGFEAGKTTARDGSVIFTGRFGEAVVIAPDGKVYRGNFNDSSQFVTLKDGSIQVNRENLRPVDLTDNKSRKDHETGSMKLP